MDISQQYLIDFSINFGGYIVALVLGVMLHKLLSKKPKTAKVIAEVKQNNDIVNPALINIQTPEKVNINTKLEFIRLGENSPKQETPQKETIPTERVNRTGRRNRPEIIKLARKMILAGATSESIKKVLPVSEAELALLTLNSNS